MDDVRHVVVKVTDTQVWTVSGGFSVCPFSVFRYLLHSPPVFV